MLDSYFLIDANISFWQETGDTMIVILPIAMQLHYYFPIDVLLWVQLLSH